MIRICWLFILSFAISLPGYCAEKPLTKANAKDAKPFVNKAHTRVRQLKGYKFHTDLKTYKGKNYLLDFYIRGLWSYG